MAFNPALLVKMQPSTLFTDPATIPNVQPQKAAPQFWLYNSSADTIATVDTDGYFKYFGQTRTVDTLLYNNGQLFNIGDLIWTVAADGNAWLEVTAITPTITTGISAVDPNSVNTAAIQANAVTLAKLAAGITPSHVIKFAGQLTTVGGAAAEAFAVAGAVAATDRAYVQIVDNGTANVSALQAVVTNNVLTVTFSGNPGADCIFNYQLIRAAA